MKNAKILIVEDEAVIALNIKKLLKNLGYTVSEIIASGEEAINKVEKINPDLVLMDITLSGEMNGIEAAEYIDKHFNIPIIYISSQFSVKTIRQIKKIKYFDYLLKPVSGNDLLLTISATLKRRLLEESQF